MTSASNKNSRISLPIDSVIPRIMSDFRAGNPLLITAEPGSGKTTRIPPALMEELSHSDRNQVWVLEPRRLAALLSARRVAEEWDEPIGERVGYHFRNDSCYGEKTRLLFLTEGMMLRRMLQDPLLEKVGAIILDEFHERHVDTDVALACIQALRKGPRPDLKCVILSATLDVDSLKKYLGEESRVHSAPGRVFPCDVKHLDHPIAESRSSNTGSDPREQALVRTLAQALDSPLREADGVKQPRDILVFLPGAREILSARETIRKAAANGQVPAVRVEVLYGDASEEDQKNALRPSSGPEPRRVILSTNIAESSVTLDGVGVVIDSGLARVASESEGSGVSTLRTRPVSRASLTQRGGRAARQGPGVVYRLMTRHEEMARPLFEVPELLRSDLSSVWITIDGWRTRLSEKLRQGEQEVGAVSFVDPPTDSAWKKAHSMLESLGAYDAQTGRLTGMGKKMGEIPLSPRLARVLIEAEHLGILPPAIRAIAALSEGGLGSRGFARKELDLVELLTTQKSAGESSLGFHEKRMISRLGSAFRLERIAQIPMVGSWESHREGLTQAFFTGFPDRVAAIKGQSCDATLCDGGVVTLTDEATARSSQYFLILDASQTARLGERLKYPKVDLLLPLSDSDILEWGIDRVEEVTQWSFDPDRARVDASDQLSYGLLVLENRRISPSRLKESSRSDAARDLARRFLLKATSRESDLKETFALRSLAHRIDYYRKAAPELGALLASAEEVLTPFVSRYVIDAEVWSLSVLLSSEHLDAILGLIRHEWNRMDELEREVPERIDLPGRKRVPVQYPDSGAGPYIESRLQDFFGLQETPRILRGRVPLTCHLLAPSQRPVQLTQDLRSFWKNTYPQLRGELARRYPRHFWPESPG